MKIISILFFLSLSCPALCQKSLFDTLKIDASTKILGLYPPYDKSRTYEKYNFIIEDSIQIKKFCKGITLDKEVANSMENPNFELTVVKNFKEIGSWTISPTLKSAMTHDGQTYKFDLKQITNLHDKYPLSYYDETKTFASKGEYETYLAKQKSNPRFLFNYAPMFKYEGSFEIEFKKSSKFPHPKAISDYLKPYIEKITTSDEYSISYILDSKNMNYTDQYTMTISGPKKLFDELKIDNLQNGNWKPTEEKGYFFYKK